MNSTGKKSSSLNINPNYPPTQHANQFNNPRTNFSVSSPIKSTVALSDIMNHSANKLQSPNASGYPAAGYSFNPSANFNRSAPIPGTPFGNPSPLPSPVAATPTATIGASATNAAAKLSKLQARKEKQNSISTTINTRKDPSSFLAANEDSNELKQIMITKELEDNFRNEKRQFFNKLQDENQLLLQLLEDIQDSKASLMKRIKELEIAKETVKALKTPTTLDAIDHYLIDECPLSENNRYELNFSSDKLSESQKLYDRLVSLMSLFKSNSSAYFEHIIEQLSDISDLFINNQYQQMNNSILQLEQILLLNPTNIEAVKILSNSIEKSLIHATADNLQEFLKKNISLPNATKTLKATLSNNSINAKESTAPTNTAPTTTTTTATAAGSVNPSVLPNDGYAESKTDQKFSNEEIQQILAQNENLRATVKQLRHRLAQVRVSSVNSTSHSSLYGTPNPKLRGLGAGTPGGPPTLTRDDSSRSPQRTGRDPTDGATDHYRPISPSTTLVHSPSTYKGGASRPVGYESLLSELGATATYTTQLPDAIQLLVISRLKSYLNQFISGNTAIPMIAGNDVIKELIVEEIIQQTHVQFYQILEIQIKNEKELEFILQSNQREVINREYLERDQHLVLTLTDYIDSIFHLTPVHAELISWMSLYCTYAYARMGITQTVVFEDNGTRYTEKELEQLQAAYQEHQPPPVLSPTSVTPATESLRTVTKQTSQSNLPRYMQSTKSFESNLRSPNTAQASEKPFTEK